MSRRERHDLSAEPHQVFGLAGKDDGAGGVIAVVERADADGIAGGNIAFRVSIVQDQRKFRVQHPEHLHAVLLIQREQDLTVGAALKGIALLLQRLPDPFESVDLTVADHIAVTQLEGLHPLWLQAHDGEPVEAEQAAAGRLHPRVVRAAGLCLLKIRQDRFLLESGGRKTDNCAHKKHLRIICAALPEINSRTNCCRSAVPPNLLSETVSFPEL